MKNKYKKQKRNIILKITAVLLCVWIVVSVAFCAITLVLEKNEQISKCDTDFNDLIYRLSVEGRPTYNDICSKINTIKTNYTGEYFTQAQYNLSGTYDEYLVKDGVVIPQIKYGTDGAQDNHVQITATITSADATVQAEPLILMDTDKEIFVTFSTKYEISRPHIYSGNVVYSDFIKSIKKEDLDYILEYLKIRKDKDGFYYAVQLKQAYYDAENGTIIPKVIELVKTSDEIKWSEQNEVVKSIKLSPVDVDGLELLTLAGDKECILDGTFITGEFSSGGLIQSPFEPLMYSSDLAVASYHPSVVEKTSPFEYIYQNYDFVSISTLGYNYDEAENAFYEKEFELTEELSLQNLTDKEYTERWTKFYDENEYLQEILDVKYVKRINLLECAKDTLLIGISSIFLFFLIIGFILTVMMCKVLKTQINEEQKRIDITNALAHDIKTPLFIISGYAQSLMENINTDKKEHYCERIIERADEVNELVHTMLDFSKLEQVENELKFDDVNVFEITNEVLSKFDIFESDKITVNNNSEYSINADKELLKRALSNLVDNAIRYSDKNSEITIDINDKFISISNLCSSITQDDVKHLTEPYYKVEKHRDSKGNGLGLSIVKSIVELHGYKLDITLNNSLITFTIHFKK